MLIISRILQICFIKHLNNYAIYTIIVLYFYVLQGGISQSCNKYFNKFMGNLNFGEGTCSVTEDCGSSLKYCFKHGFDFDAKPTKIDINFPGRFTTQVLTKIYSFINDF